MDDSVLQKTTLLSTDAESDDIDDCEGLHRGQKIKGQEYDKWHQLPTLDLVLLVILVLVSNTFSGFLGAYIVGRRSGDLDSTCAAYTSQYSPVLKEVRVEYSITRFNGSFMREDIYRQAGSPEVDAAWEALGVDYRAGVIPHEEGLRSGLSSAHVQRSAKYGRGFFVNVEGLHHLHCLNLVRKSLYFNYPYYKLLGTHEFSNNDTILQLHVSHCVDTLRQVLMCNADTGVLGQVWYNKDEPRAFPDFKTEHKCKNYEAIRQWAEGRQEPPVQELPPDYVVTPLPDEVLVEVP